MPSSDIVNQYRFQFSKFMITYIPNYLYLFNKWKTLFIFIHSFATEILNEWNQEAPIK